MIHFEILKNTKKQSFNLFQKRGLLALGAWATGIAGLTLWQKVLGTLEIGPLALRPGIFASVALAIMSFPVALRRGSENWLWLWVCIGTIAIMDQAPIAARASGLDIAPIAWKVGILPSVALAVFAWRLSQKNIAAVRFASVELFWATSLVVMMIGIFQGFNRIARVIGVPNESRSVVLGGIEVHHITWGVLLLAIGVVLLWGIQNTKVARYARVLVIGLGCGFIADEWFYIALVDVTDDAYFEPITWVSALALAIILPMLWKWFTHDKPH